MAASQIDLHVVERLIGQRFDTISTSDCDKLGPGEQPPTEPTKPFAQFLGCDFDTVLRSTADGENQTVRITAEFLCAAPVTTTRADAYQVMTAASAILAAIGEFSSTGANCEVTLDEAVVRRRAFEELPQFRCVVITATGRAQRTSGTSRE